MGWRLIIAPADELTSGAVFARCLSRQALSGVEHVTMAFHDAVCAGRVEIVTWSAQRFVCICASAAFDALRARTIWNHVRQLVSVGVYRAVHATNATLAVV
jgi:hypothetical protein